MSCRAAGSNGALRRKRCEARDAQDSLQRERERLAWQIGEVDKLAPGADEWDELNAQHGRLSNAQACATRCRPPSTHCRNPTRTPPRCWAGDCGAAKPGTHGARIQGHRRSAELRLAQMEDAVALAQRLPSACRPRTQRLAELDERMSSWVSLARRYKRRRPNCPNCWPAWKAELQKLDAAADLASLKKTKPRPRRPTWRKPARCPRRAPRPRPSWPRPSPRPCRAWACRAAASTWRWPTRTTGPAWPGDIGRIPGGGPPGSTPRPVGKVASGGELSRIALAIAVTTSQLGQAETLIFDEVDSGVGGAVAETVGRLMKQLGKRPPGAGGHPPAAGGRLRRPAPGGRQAKPKTASPSAPWTTSTANSAWPKSPACWAANACPAPRWPTPRKCWGSDGMSWKWSSSPACPAPANRWPCMRWRTPAITASTTCRPSCCCRSSHWSSNMARKSRHRHGRAQRDLAAAGAPAAARSCAPRAWPGAIPVPRRQHRNAGAPLLRDAPPHPLSRIDAETDQHRRRWSTPSSSSANCWPTCASRPTSSTPAPSGPRSCRAR
jgi:hypothetical protein